MREGRRRNGRRNGAQAAARSRAGADGARAARREWDHDDTEQLMKRTVRKAVFPVAGLGTRFLPATKANPKEMLPIVDKPLIQYAVEEAVASGITHMVFITGRNKRAIEDHFDKAYELENELSERGRHNLLGQVRDIVPKTVACTYVRQT